MCTDSQPPGINTPPGSHTPRQLPGRESRGRDPQLRRYSAARQTPVRATCHLMIPTHQDISSGFISADLFDGLRCAVFAGNLKAEM